MNEGIKSLTTLAEESNTVLSTSNIDDFIWKYLEQGATEIRLSAREYGLIVALVLGNVPKEDRTQIFLNGVTSLFGFPVVLDNTL